MNVDLNDRIAVVTGGAQGIGRAIVQDLADNGAHVVIVDLNREASERAALDVVEAGGICLGLAGDVSDIAQMERVIGDVVDRFGRIDIMVNNAGIGNPHRVLIHEQPPEDWNRVLQIDLTGIFATSRMVVPVMLTHGGGAIVNISSVAGLVPLRLQSAYDAAKAGVVNLTRAMAIELGAQGIRVNAVAPGTMENVGIFYGPDGGTYTEQGKRLLSHVPLGRPGRFEEIAHVVLFLVSPDASYVNGAVIPVDGGWIAGYHRDW